MRTSTRCPLPVCSARGFGAANLPQDTARWEENYKAYVKRNGELLCAMAWEGYETLGRGAVFANYDGNPDTLAMLDVNGKTVKSAMPSFYISKEKLMEQTDPSAPNLAPIVSRISTYDPQRQFVVIFESDGTQGADIVTPNQAPSEVWARTRLRNKQQLQ